MTKPKQLVFLLLLFIIVGIAAVSTNVIISGSTQLASNPDDFNVYFSNVLVNGAQDLSLVKSETSLVFTGEFSAVGDKKEITYDVTNASKNYDADIAISCTQSTSYLTITNSFDTSTNLAATSTRTGVLTITLSKSYTGADLTQDISCTLNASAVERTSQGDGVVSAPLNPYYIGKEISIGSEKFNVISDNGTTITMYAQYNVDVDTFKQTKDQTYPMFSDNGGWEYGFDIDIQQYDGQGKTILNNYVDYIKSLTNDDEVSGNLISLNDLKALGCLTPVHDSYSGEEPCADSLYEDWLVNGQGVWTRTPIDDNNVWVFDTSYVECSYNLDRGIRPTITISKNVIDYIQSLKIFYVGEEVAIGNEKFNVVSDNGTTISMLAQYNIDETTYKQTTEQMWTLFSDSSGWEFIPAPKEIDIQVWGSESKEVLNNYVNYLNTEYQLNVTGTFITVRELKSLGCSISEDYSTLGDCSGSSYKSWLLNKQYWWTRSAHSNDDLSLWYVMTDGTIHDCYYGNDNGAVRPVITILKEYLE